MAGQRPLIQVVASEIVRYALVAIGLQVIIVFATYYRDDAELARLMVDAEASSLRDGFSVEDGRLSYEQPAALTRYATPGRGYLARIRTGSGTILFTNCDDSCSRHLLPPDLNPPDFWLRQLTPDKPITVVGGRLFDMDGERVFIELAILGDPDGIVWTVLGHELFDHMAVPMALMLVFVLGATLLAIRRALRPVSDAAAQAARIDPLDATTRLRAEGMPREIGHLALAVNQAIARIGELIRAQKVFTAAVAHEIRTPLAMMRLELGHISGPRARKAEADLQSLAHFVDKVTSLARLEAVTPIPRRPIDPTTICRSVIMAMAPWVFDAQHGIGFAERSGILFQGDPSLVEDALRNLVENAVRHTPPGTQITVESGPGTRIAVVDDAGVYRMPTQTPGGHPGNMRPAGGVGIGLEIVRRIAALHDARFEIDVDPGKRTSAALQFPETA